MSGKQSYVGEKIHGQSGTPLYECWKNMKARCYNPSSERFYCYGAIGITVDENWLDFQNFEKWAKDSGYEEGLTIDRIDPTKKYCPDNCRWVTYEENHREMMRFNLENSRGLFTEESKQKSKIRLREKLGKKIKISKDNSVLEFNSRGECAEYLASILNRSKNSVKAQINQCLSGKAKSCGGYNIYE